MPAPPRAGAMGPAGGARAAPSLLLSLLLGASAPLWLRAEKLGESGRRAEKLGQSGRRAGRGSGVHGPRGFYPALGVRSRVLGSVWGVSAVLVSLLRGSAA